MLVPSMLNMADVMADSCYTEEQVFDLGLSQVIVFLVVVPLVGACRVPNDALSHFMAGADEYKADAMPEHYSGALSGPWTIKRERLRILPDSWGKWMTFVDDVELLDDVTPAPVGAVGASGGVMPDKAGPLPLTTGDIAFCFAGLRCKTEEEWKDLIGKGRVWVERCLIQPGTRGRGGAPKLWNPVCIGAALVRACI